MILPSMVILCFVNFNLLFLMYCGNVFGLQLLLFVYFDIEASALNKGVSKKQLIYIFI